MCKKQHAGCDHDPTYGPRGIVSYRAYPDSADTGGKTHQPMLTKYPTRTPPDGKRQEMLMSDRRLNPISDAELNRRWAAIRAGMKDRGIDALVMQEQQ